MELDIFVNDILNLFQDYKIEKHNRIEINLKYRDEYETIIDYLYNNRLIVFSLEQYKNAEIVKQMRMATKR